MPITLKVICYYEACDLDDKSAQEELLWEHACNMLDGLPDGIRENTEVEFVPNGEDADPQNTLVP